MDFFGTNGNDTIVGSNGDDRLFGLNGNDFLDGRFGFDLIDGGAGVDTTSYAFYAGPINANLSTGVVSFPGNSVLTDTLVSIENVIGTAGNDVITGSAANNSLSGGNGNDTLNGGAGNDFLDGGFGFDLINGGTGVDTTSYAFYAGPINANLSTGVVSFPGNSVLTDTLVSIENVIGTAGNDVITGSAANNSLSGGNGNDTLNGGAGNDFLDGGFGFDLINGGTGVDTTSYAFYAGPINANLSTGVVSFPGNSVLTDTLVSIENVIGTAGNDVITGSAANNSLSGGNGNDTINGGLGNDTLNGGSGNDTLIGGLGLDTLNGGTGNDLFDYNSVNESPVGASRDKIVGFAGAGAVVGDRIDLTTIDANSLVAGNQAFIWGGSFTTGHLRYVGGVLQGNTDADAAAEFEIQLVGAPALVVGGAGTDILL
ncbi:MAG: calcium-binding protein [Nitrospira sp.]|nr:calcium-binding protein [Nitrospira sp.]